MWLTSKSDSKINHISKLYHISTGKATLGLSQAVNSQLLRQHNFSYLNNLLEQ